MPLGIGGRGLGCASYLQMNGEEIGMALRTFSYGGGVQSTAALVLAAEGKIDFNIFLFANTGDDSENPKSLVYVREVAMPYAAAHGIALHELQRHTRDGQPETLYGRITRADIRRSRSRCGWRTARPRVGTARATSRSA
jgi:hypothetical protein